MLGFRVMWQQHAIWRRRDDVGTGRRWVGGVSIRGAVRELLDSDAVAQVVTLNADGSPHVTAAWVGVEGDEIVLATIPDQRKLRNLRRDPPPGFVTRITPQRFGGVGPWNPPRG
jgi:hypothetical protein